MDVEDRSDSHVAPGGDAALVHVAGQVDQLSVDVLQAEGAEGLLHALGAQGRGGAALQGQQAQQQDLQQLQTRAGRSVFLFQSGLRDLQLCGEHAAPDLQVTEEFILTPAPELQQRSEQLESD